MIVNPHLHAIDSAAAALAIPARGDVPIVDRLARDPAAEHRSLAGGLLATPASIAPKYFYDPLGCALFAAICELAEYYPTRTERAIFERHRAEIAAAVGRGKTLVDLGAGDCAKARAWMPWLAPDRYVAVDIAAPGLASALAGLAVEFPDVEMLGVIADFTHALDLRRDLGSRPCTFFYPGSSIGNFSPDDALRFLRDAAQHTTLHAGGGLLIGVDTPKERARLVAAYDDPLGVTAAFNRNILNHVNHVLATDFRADAFAHVARYDEAKHRIEIYLEAMSAQTVRIDGIARTFAEGERIHTENSYKYTPAQFRALLESAGFTSIRVFTDDAGDFAVYYAT
jgi:dimethylhistidine N-methyltransferase